MAKNTDGTFLKLGTIGANLVGTVFELRQDIAKILSDDLKDKKFVMMRETLKDIEGSKEKKLSVTEVYSSDCVLIRFVNENGKFHSSLLIPIRAGTCTRLQTSTYG